VEKITNEIIKNVLSKKQITIAQMITFLIGLSVFIFMETQMFRETHDIIKVVIYVALYGSFLIFGVELFATKKLALGVRDIIANKKLPLEEKIMAITQVVSEALIRLGEAWEIFDKEQFEKKEGLPEKY